MCGIVARFSKGYAKPFHIVSQLDQVQHRGPDARGAFGWNDDDASFSRLDETEISHKCHIIGHVRLAIIDLSDAAVQPFVSTDGRFVLSYNGEIYNYVELRQQLLARGIRFRTESDTEVLLQAWDTWGPRCLDMLEGMFAFVLFDRHSNKVFMCRDPFGIKPLFVLSKGDEVVVCSEIGPLVSRLGRLVYNERNISHILRWGCDDGFEETFAQHIARIRPGTCRSLDLATLQFGDEFRYFDIDAISERDWSFGEAKIALRDTFVSSVDHHMRSDAELGFALSGGIDSSAIVCAARELGRSPIRTFSYIAHEEKISELKWVELVVKRVGADATLVRPTTNDLQRNLPWVAGHQGEPFGSLSIFAQNEVYRKVAERGVKVILSGQGADELLAGYLNFLLSFVASEIRRGRFLSAQTLLRTMRQRFNMSFATTARWLARQMLPEQLKERVAERYLKRKAPWLNVREIVASGVASLVDINPDTAARSRLKQTMKFAIKDTLVALLRYDDRNSMSHSVESRVPFLTPKMATICLSLPDQFLISSKGVSKHIFREAMRGIVPDRILDRNDKVNFAPDNRAWRAAITNLCSEDEPHLELRRIIDTHKLRLALEKPAEDGEPIEMLWRAVNILMMDRQYRLANQT